MKNFLVVVDMQNDFISGSLGTPEAQAIVPAAAARIAAFDGEIFVTMDTHELNYPDTAEGRKLPVMHCLHNSHGWKLDERISAALEGKKVQVVEKPSFGSTDLPHLLRYAAGFDTPQNEICVEMMGLCTDICVVSNALILKACYPEAHLCVNASCCAGVTPDSHAAALKTMESCQIDLV